MKRRTARERALQALYQIELGQIDPKEAIENVLEENNEVGTDFLNELVFGYVNHKEEVDSTISKHLENWTLDRIGSIDRNILRSAISEMNYLDDIPTNVTINEAIEIAKVYGDNESTRFINGVLGQIQATHKE